MSHRRYLVFPLLAVVVGACGGTSDSETCSVSAGQCPNVCSPGIGVQDEVCATTADCKCGLFCKVQEPGKMACARYEGPNAGCLCTAPPPPGETAPDPVIGSGGSVPEAATLTEIDTQKLDDPADLAFSPKAPNELWVVSPDNDAITVVADVRVAKPVVRRFIAPGDHFLDRVMGIAFGPDGTFATCGDSDNSEAGNGDSAPGFMGPVWWPGDLETFIEDGQSDASRVHWDMLHSTNFCMGVAGDATGGAYYLFNGEEGTIDWNDFKTPHEPGGTDHKDGTKKRYLGLGLARKAGVPSGLELDSAGRWLYIADTGNHRLVRLDVTSGKPSGTQSTYSDEQPLTKIKGATLEEVVSAASGLLTDPSGVALRGDRVYVTDAANGSVAAFDLAGARLTSLVTGLPAGALGGIAIGPDGRLYVVDRLENRVVRIDPTP